MSGQTIIRRAEMRDVGDIFDLIIERIEWMNKVGIRQWNTDGYLDAFPREYYEKNIGSFYIAEQDGKIVGAVALYESDERWPDGERAIYVHHLVTDLTARGAGRELLAFAEKEAMRRGMTKIRLDSEKGNEKLAKYYADAGYTELDEFCEGEYIGIRREKIISQ